MRFVEGEIFRRALHRDEASAALFRSASYGEFLNQDILCLQVGYPATVKTACDPGSAKPGVGGAAALEQLVSGASR